MYKVGLISLGCAKNLVDSEMILGALANSKFEIVNTIQDSDVIIVNTCGFIEASKEESIENILDVCKYGKKVVVTGCLVERYLDELKASIPEVDLWIPIRDYSHFSELIEKMLENKQEVEPLNPFVRMLSTPPWMAYLRISEGCNNCCAYCAIPLIRGHFRSRPFDDVILEAKLLAENGIKELVLISQDTTRYGTDFKPQKSVVDLLKELVKIPEFKSIRLLYLYPDEISENLIDFIAKTPVISPYFDIPFQHSSDPVLKGMLRRGTHESYQQLIDQIRAKIPHAIIRTTYIVGFPGETDDDFVDLVAFTRKNKFDHMGAFKYSREDGTKAYNYDNQVEEALKSGRLAKIMEVQKKISYQNNKARVGEIMHGIVVEYNPTNKVYGLRSYWNAPDDIDGKISFVSNRELKLGDEVDVKITNAFVYDLFGEIVE
ncbi:MAG: 30S ribosomal protein S12 methylthiotransferase RimO [Bacilli bacterium]|nr:30S ribosomal protein S12 methylthiotransferase RimO [Bacilli bacterium]